MKTTHIGLPQNTLDAAPYLRVASPNSCLPEQALSVLKLPSFGCFFRRARAVVSGFNKSLKPSGSGTSLPLTVQNRTLTAIHLQTTMASNSVTLVVGSETFQTSYTITLKSGSRPGPTPLTHGWPIVLYDQLGTGESTRKPPGFYTAALSVAKLDNLIQHLRIERDFDLLGHSWGVMYIGAHRPQGARVPHPHERCHEREGTIDAREYQEGFMWHALNLEVWPPGRGPYGLQGDVRVPAVSNLSPNSFPRCISWAHHCASLHRLGIDEFVMTGVLKDWSVNPKLGKVSWPTLIINGADDAVQDCSVAPLFYGIEKAKWVTLGSSSHMAFWE
ncbi:Alpha/Beta hydrolase protein [Lactarius deliciosus]|nr:Alpha/Beta hydrolase protein [Lactarius deliciosus]